MKSYRNEGDQLELKSYRNESVQFNMQRIGQAAHES